MSAAIRSRLAMGVAFIALATLPIWMAHPYYINISSQILFWAIIALGLNVLVGYAGLTSLGHSGLFAITAYTVGLMVDAGHGHLVRIGCDNPLRRFYGIERSAGWRAGVH